MSTNPVHNICPICNRPLCESSSEDQCIYFSKALASTNQYISDQEKVYISRLGGKALKGAIHLRCWEGVVGR